MLYDHFVKLKFEVNLCKTKRTITEIEVDHIDALSIDDAIDRVLKAFNGPSRNDITHVSAWAWAG